MNGMKIVRKNITLIAFILLLLGVLLIIILKSNLNSNKDDDIVVADDLEEKNTNGSNSTDEELCTVDIKGEVKLPGVYKSKCGKYVSDIISLAGGLTEKADTTYINLAKKISDEMVIMIYSKEDIMNLKNNEESNYECVCPEITNDSCINDNFSNREENVLVNINTASLNELMNINGIGETRAKAIIEYRNKYGLFKQIEDILKVNGIGEKLYEQIKIFITT